MRKARNVFNYIRLYGSIGLICAVFAAIVVYILANGLSHLTWDFLSSAKGLLPAIITTLWMIVLTLLVAVPIGIGSAIYLHEYAKPGSRMVKAIRLATESLAGIPSIIYGLFGFMFFVIALKWSWSMLAGICTLAIMVLPTIMSATEEALIAVPDSYREGSYALGAGKFVTIARIVFRSALPGIFASVILAIGRIVGETAALTLTAGTVLRIPEGRNMLFQSASTLSVYMYTLASEGLHFGEAYATAIVLLITVLCVNLLAKFIINRFIGQKGEH